MDVHGERFPQCLNNKPFRDSQTAIRNHPGLQKPAQERLIQVIEIF